MYTIQRSGDFYAIPRGDDYCGEIQPNKPHRFTYTVRCSGPQLGSRGFLMDQVDLQTQFDAIGSFTESCELLAYRMASSIMVANSKLNLVSCSVGPSANVQATVELRRPRKVKTAGVSSKYQDDFFGNDRTNRVQPKVAA